MGIKAPIKYLRILPLIALLLFWASWGYISTLTMSFNGVVTRVWYRTPPLKGRYFRVSGKDYEYNNISPSNTNDTIAEGDSVVKGKWTTTFILIKPKKSAKTLVGDSSGSFNK